MIHEKSLLVQKVTLCCALSPAGVIGHFFFENDEGQAESQR